MFGTQRRPRPGQPAASGAVDPRPALRRIVAEAVILQDEAESLIRGVHARQPLGLLAPRGGPLVRRFFSLRDRLPTCAAADDLRIRRQVDAILHHHALTLSFALDLLACEWRSPRMSDLIERLDGLGAPAQDLDRIYSELASRGERPSTPSR